LITQRRATVGSTPLDEWSARRRVLYLTTQHTQQTNIHAPGGIRTHDRSRRVAVDLRLRPRGRWDRLYGRHTCSIYACYWKLYGNRDVFWECLWFQAIRPSRIYVIDENIANEGEKNSPVYFIYQHRCKLTRIFLTSWGTVSFSRRTLFRWIGYDIECFMSNTLKLVFYCP
jgi:hypothetical protein